MKSECGFSYMETIIGILLTALLVGIVGQMTALAINIRQAQAEETYGYLLAYSTMERWKVDGDEQTFLKEAEGQTYHVMVRSQPLTKRVEKCEVLVRWGQSEANQKQIRVKGSRFLTVVPVTETESEG